MATHVELAAFATLVRLQPRPVHGVQEAVVAPGRGVLFEERDLVGAPVSVLVLELLVLKAVELGGLEGNSNVRLQADV